MLNYLLHSSPADASLWMMAAFFQVVSVLAIHHGRSVRNYPAFSVYLYYVSGVTLLLMAVPVNRGFAFYSWLMYLTSTAECLLVVIVIGDLYLKTLAPESLPHWARRHIATCLAIVVSLGAVVCIVVRPQYGPQTIRALSSIQETLIAIAALSLYLLIFLSRRFHVAWWPRDARITTGFVLLLSIEAVTLLFIFAGNHYIALRAQRILQVGGIFAFGCWSWQLWEREPIQALASPEEAEIGFAIHRATMSAREEVSRCA